MIAYNMSKDFEDSITYLEEQRQKAIKENPKIMKYTNSEIDIVVSKNFVTTSGSGLKRGIPMWVNIPIALFSIFGFTYMCTEQIIYVYIAIFNLLLFFLFRFMVWIMSSVSKVEIKNPMYQYRDYYKENIILPLLNSIGRDIEYEKDTSITKKHKELRSANSEDYVQMNIGDVRVEFGETFHIGKEDTNSDDPEEVESRYIVCVATFNKEIKSQTLLEPRLRLPSDIFTFNISKPNKYIKLDNEAFNDTFFVLADDEIEARYILAHTMMEKILKLSKQFPSIRFLFQNNKIIFSTRIYYGYTDGLRNYDLFDYVVQSDVYDQTQKHYDIVSSVASIIKSLDLDSKIWK